MILRTKLGKIVKPSNAENGKMAPDWGTSLVMGGFMLAFLVFLVIILEIYNASVTLDNIDVDWVTP